MKSLPAPMLTMMLLFIGAALSVAVVFAEDYPRRPNFQNIMQNQDIALGEVEAITQDHEGFMWIGGRNALLRYDGYEFLPILIEIKETGLTKNEDVNQVIELFEDSRYQLWVATRSGIYQYDRDREILRSVRGLDDPLTKVATENVFGIDEAPTGEILLVASGGLYIYNTASQTYKHLAKTGADFNGLTDNALFDVVTDKNNNRVWLGSAAGLERVDWATKMVAHFIPDSANPTLPANNAVRTLAQDLDGDVWIGVDNGLYRFNVKTETFTRYQNNPADAGSLSANRILNIFVDKKGWVWVASETGLNLYDKQKDKFIRFLHEDGRASSLSSSTTRRVYQDDSGDMWVGTYPTGVNFYDRSTDAISLLKPTGDPNTGLLDKTVEAITEDKEGNLWIGAGGVTRYSPEEDIFTHYRNTPIHPGIKTKSPIVGYTDSEGGIWFGSWANSYHHYNPKTDIFDQMPFDPVLAGTTLKNTKVLPDGVVWSVFEDRQKNLWLGMHNSGLTKYDRTTGGYKHYFTVVDDPTTLSNPIVWKIFEDSNGRFWVGTSRSLNLMDREKETFKRYEANPKDPHQLANGSVLAIYEDHKGRLWFGTDAGLHVYREATDDFLVYNTKDGFVGAGIRNITEDPAGNLWLGTNNGIVMFNADTQVVRNYVRYNGERIGEASTGASITTRKGLVAIGTLNGLYLFDTTKLDLNKKIPPVVVTDFSIFTKKIAADESASVLTKVANQTQKIVLDYTKTMISFNFAALNFRDPDKNRFAYKLEGFDESWREVGNKRSALYTNLDAGTYIFRVKASNNDGIWNDEGRSITLVQLPPPWKTLWAYAIYGLMLITITIQFVQSQRKKRRLVEEQNRLLEIKVAERTCELREKNDDIQAMLSNMRQGLFTLEVDGNIHPEYSHFLQEIFETTTITGTKGMHLLFGQSNLGSDRVNQIQQALNTILGEDEINYGFNAHLLIREYEATINVHHKFLSLDWNPIVVNDVVIKVMVSVRDVTLLKQMERDAQAKKRELDIISQLLNVPRKKYLSFVLSCMRFVEENRAQIAKYESRSDTLIASLFRNMHTVKGNCRTIGFSHFSDVVHDVEAYYSQLKKDTECEWNRQQLLQDLMRVDAILAEYQHIYRDVLGRGDSNSLRDQKGFWADGKAIDTIQQCLDAMHKKFPSPQFTKEWQPIQGVLNAALSTPLVDVVADIVESLPSIAVQLQKETPNVNITDNNIRIKADSCELISNIFAHILHNCVDHGIETPDVRAQAGKQNRGTIDINAEVENDILSIRVKDDGQGVNIDRLFKKGVEIGQWKNTDQPSYQTIADLIFASGVSTKEQVTDISGRGVGMDAVKQFLVEKNGNIELRLLQAGTRHEVIGQGIKVPFELVITLPCDIFMRVI